ncbi:hypothetical protein HY379_01320 [Candidatus Saccharibacteria bacterium]|nr:hypothetical protein [Candidatus Saccharibacteria bacterium]
MFFEFFKWWYGSGWLGAWNNVGGSAKKIQRGFAIGVLLKSLFAPWKQVITIPGRSLDEKFRASIDNLVSRSVGFFVRLLTLTAAAAIISASTIFNLVIAAAWPLLPIALIYSFAKAFIG